jgi:DNA-binding MarR family transcriptional regulator
VYSSNKPGSTPCACTTVKKVSRLLGRVYDAALVDAGLNITQLGVLRCISRRAGEPLVRVAEELEMDRTSLYRAINPMIRDGWIVFADGVNARTKSAKVTKKGLQVLASADIGWSDVQSQLIRRFGRVEYAALISELHRLADCAEASQAARS